MFTKQPYKFNFCYTIFTNIGLKRLIGMLKSETGYVDLTLKELDLMYCLEQRKCILIKECRTLPLGRELMVYVN